MLDRTTTGSNNSWKLLEASEYPNICQIWLAEVIFLHFFLDFDLGMLGKTSPEHEIFWDVFIRYCIFILFHIILILLLLLLYSVGSFLILNNSSVSFAACLEPHRCFFPPYNCLVVRPHLASNLFPCWCKASPWDDATTTVLHLIPDPC